MTPTPDPLRGLTPLFALACGLIVANLYYAQPLTALIGPDLGLHPAMLGLIVTLTQVGYGLGLLLVVPLADVLENRRLSVGLLIGVAAGLATIAASGGAAMFFAATLATGLCAVVAQILVPFASHLAPEAVRGRVVGKVMSGLLGGILLARPLASLVADVAGWRLLFAASALTMLGLAAVLYRRLPLRQPASPLRYPQLLASLARVWRETPVLHRRAAYHAALFAAFSLFWTAVPLLLASPTYGYSQRGIALFALAGAAGALAAPWAGRIADRGWTRPATGSALLLGLCALALADWTGARVSVVGLLIAALLLDVAVSTNLVLGQRTLYALGPEVRSRLNALYMACFFGGGALGSALAGWAWTQGGWPRVCLCGMVFLLPALALFVTELRPAATRLNPSSANPRL